MKIILFLFSFILLFFSCNNNRIESDPLVDALLKKDWAILYNECFKSDSLLQKPETAALMGHAAIMLNNNNTSFILLKSVDLDSTKCKDWQNWADNFVQRYPQDAVAFYFQGDANMRNGNKTKALECFNKAIDLDNNFALAFNARGILYSLNNDKINALADLKTACNLDTTISNFYTNKATIEYNNRAPEGAYRSFEKALKISPSFALALNGKACSMLYNGEMTISEESRIDSISLFFYNAYNQLALSLIQENIRRLTREIENRMFPDLIESPLFRVSDFLDWDVLRQRSLYDDFDILKLILKDTLPKTINANFLIQLNTLLNKKLLFDQVLKNQSIPNSINDSVKSIIRNISQTFSMQNISDTLKQQYINRLILEKLYSGLIASWKERKPGMQLTSRGFVTADQYRHNMASSQIFEAQIRVDEYKFWARAAEGIPLVGPAIGGNWGAHLDQATNANQRALQSKGIDMNKTNPGGVLVDIRRSSIDDDVPYSLICINGLGYE